MRNGNLINRQKYNVSDALKVFPLAFIAFFAAAELATLRWLIVVDSIAGFWDFYSIGDLLVQALTSFSLFATPFIYCKIVKIDFLKATTFTQKPDYKAILISILAVAGLILAFLPVTNMFVSLLTEFTEEIGADAPSVDLEIADTSFLSVVLSLVIYCVIPAVCEETLFRGVMTQGYTKLGKIGACFACGAIFMIFHMNPAQTVYQFALGTVLGYFMLTTRCIWIPIIMHFINNAFSILTDMFMSDEVFLVLFVDYIYITIPIGLILLAGAIVLTHFFVKDNYTEFELKEETAEDTADLPVNEDTQTPITADETDKQETQNATDIAQVFPLETQNASAKPDNLPQPQKYAGTALGLIGTVITVSLCCLFWLTSLLS